MSFSIPVLKPFLISADQTICPDLIPAPIINIVSNSSQIVSFTVTSNYDNNTYITFGPDFPGNPQACSQFSINDVPDPTESSPIYISGSGSVYQGNLSCSSNIDFVIKARTYWNGSIVCPPLQSSIVLETGKIN